MLHEVYLAQSVRNQISDLKPYTPGLAIDDIKEKYNLDNVIKMASNENPLGVSPLVQERVQRAASSIFRYPQSGNPRLTQAIAKKHHMEANRIIVGNGSDEIIDLLIRVRCTAGKDNIVCFKPCFSMYSVQAHICGVELRQAKLNEDFSFPFEELQKLVDGNTKLVFITTPDNPSGYCPTRSEVLAFAEQLPPNALLVIDEAYMDFADEEKFSLLYAQDNSNIFEKIAFLRTFSKSYALAGIRLGYAILPKALAEFMWRARMPFSVNILAEEAGLAALEDTVFYETSLQTVHEGRKQLTKGLVNIGCHVWPSYANFLLFAPPTTTTKSIAEIFEALLQRGIIIRPLKSYDLPHLFRVSVGTAQENSIFLQILSEVL